MGRLTVILLCMVWVSQVLAADALPGTKHFVVDDSGPVVDFLALQQINAPAPKPVTKYKREFHFGRWMDFPTDDTCLTTRGLVLDRETLVPLKFYEHYPCHVAKGYWYDPYTDRKYSLATQVEIDHAVPLKNAYLSGAWEWSWRRRCSYFNFLATNVHLIPIESKTNSAKLDYGPERWLPPNKKYHCQYVANWMRIKTIWKLRLSEKEATAIQNLVLARKCNPEQFTMTQEELAAQRLEIIKTANQCPANPPPPKKPTAS